MAMPAGALLALTAYAVFVPLEPMESRFAAAGTVVLASDGQVLFTERADGLRIPVALEDVAPIMREATVAAEDQRYWAHPGVDPIAVTRALVRLPEERSGASTITQQLARRLYLSEDGSPLLVRKAREALLALQIEARTSKEEVLGAYLNEVFYGRGAYGIEAAARTYFGVSAGELDLAQASFLAGLPQLPALYADPAAEPEARARQRYVLGRLVDEGVVTAAEAAAAGSAALTFEAAGEPDPARHFTGYVFEELAEVAPELANRGGLVIETTLDLGLQGEAERSAAVRVASIAERHGATNAAVVVLEARTGAILAMVGGVDFEGPAGQVNLATAPRQPGSTLKPFLYLAALERGYTAATPLLDVPSTFTTEGGVYEPVNYDLQFRGPVTLRTALASSLNVPAVRTLDEVGVDAFMEMADRVGLETLERNEAFGLALTLGGGEVTLVDLAAAYGVLADAGRRHEAFAIARVRDASTGAVLYERLADRGVSVVGEAEAFVIGDVLRDPVARSGAFGFGSVLETAYGAAVKTGTSSLFRDSWTAGFSSEVVVAAWVGNADGAPMRDLPGVLGAAPIWRDVMDEANASRPAQPAVPPDGLVRASVCSPTGLEPGTNCAAVVEEWFIAGTEPREAERYFVAAGPTLAERPPVLAQPWAVDAGVRTAGGNLGSLAVVQPAAGSVLYLAPEFGESEVLLRAAVPADAVRVRFAIDGETVGVVEGADARMRWRISIGEHELFVSAELADGQTVSGSVQFEVRSR
jgi:penicillin-binding protein 1C